MSEPTRVVSILPPGNAYSRYLMVKALAQGDLYRETAIAEALRDTPQVKATLDLMRKSAVSLARRRIRRLQVRLAPITSRPKHYSSNVGKASSARWSA